MALLAASRYTANREVIERSDRIGLRPQPHSTRLEPRVVMVEVQSAVEPGLDVVADRHDAHQVPLAERGGLHARARQLTAPAVVVVKPEIVLESVGANDVVLAVVEAEDDAARCVFLSRERILRIPLPRISGRLDDIARGCRAARRLWCPRREFRRTGR